jgi:VCBS repeat-containing protein
LIFKENTAMKTPQSQVQADNQELTANSAEMVKDQAVAKPLVKVSSKTARKATAKEALLLKKKHDGEQEQPLAQDALPTDSHAQAAQEPSAPSAPAAIQAADTKANDVLLAQASTGVVSDAGSGLTSSTTAPASDMPNLAQALSTVSSAVDAIVSDASAALASAAEFVTPLGAAIAVGGVFAINQLTGNSGSASAVIAPVFKSLAVHSGAAGAAQIDLTFDLDLDAAHLPAASAFAVKINGTTNQVTAVAINGKTVTLTLADAVGTGSLSVAVDYTDPTAGNDTNAIQDAAGNDAATISIVSGVVADGHIKGASVYIDTNNDGLATSADYLVGTTDADGRFFIPKNAPAGKLLVTGGVNTDTGVPNTLVLKAPAPDLSKPLAINPLTTLVTSLMTGTVTAAQAADKVAMAFGLTLPAGGSLLSIDPITAAGDTNTAAFGLAAQKVAAQIATIVTLASKDSSASTGAASKVFDNLATKVSSASTAQPVNLSDTTTLSAVLNGAVSSSTAVSTLTSSLATAVTAIQNASSVDTVSTAQSQVLDTIAPAAPTGVSAASLTNDTTPEVKVSLNVTSLDGTAVANSDTVELYEGSTLLTSVKVTAADIAKGYVLISPDATHALAQGSHDLTAKVKDNAGNSSTISATAKVAVDSVAPTWTSASTAATNENVPAGTVVYTATSTDANSTTYSLKATGDAAAFSINASTGAVSLLASPNYEAKASYSFTVVATDAAGNSSEKAVTLAVNNLDEVAPTITSAATATAVNENVTAGRLVYTATSTDTGDIATGATAYSLKATGDAAAFSINASTGAVSLLASPNYEAKASYSFTVVATDAAGNASEKAVTLAINNLDEVAPSITSAATATAVNENVAAVTVVYTATSTDTGDIATGATAYSLKATGDASAFSINAATGSVSLLASPNYEAKASYSFTVVATDAAGNASEKAVTLAVNNLDEVAPTITSAATAAAVNENVAAGTVVYTATSTDTADVPTVATAATNYSLKANTGDASAFSINASTGAVSLLASPNYEAKASYSFTVVATDAAGNSSEKAVTLAVNNLDEVAPTITSGTTATAVNENVAAGTLVYTATSTDTGDIATGSTTYSLKANTGDASAFSINATTGAVTLVGSPNFEQQANYSFTVVATDAAGNALEQTVTLHINNVNEAPAISSATTATVAENGTGAAYTTVATDPDANTTLAYTIAGADAALFNIDASTGVVTFKTAPNFEAPADAGANNVYDITVTASDGGLSATQAVAISVTNVNEAPTVANQIAAKVFVAGGSSNTYQVPANTFADVDAGTTLTYSAKLADGSALPAWLKFDASTRTFSEDKTVSTSMPAGALTVRVTASDGALTAYDDFVLTSVTAPVVQSFSVSDSITSNGTSLGKSGEALSFVVTLSEAVTTTGTLTAHFSVNGQDVVATSAAVTGASTITFTGAVPATGDGTSISLSSLTSTSAITGDVSHQALVASTVTYAGYTVDNTAPAVTSTTISMPENSTAAVALTATDAGAVTWALGTGNDTALFGLSNGSLSLLAAKNYEADPHAYTVNVIATDAAGNVKNQAVTVNLTNVNEEPSISSGTAATFSENGTGAAYTTVATDPDANTTLTYTIAGADAALFNISSTGVVTFKAAPNFEAPADAGANNVYDITVNTTDGALSASKAVAITVTNVNEAPTISSAATATFAENGTGTAYTTVATDPDAGTTLTYSLAGADAAKFSISNTGVVTFNTAPNFEAPTDAGANNVYDIVVNTTDGALTASQAVAITVTNVNEAPVASAIDNQSALVGSSSTINLAQYFSDPDAGDALTYALSGATLPTGLTFSTSTGVISGTASAVLADTTFHVVATDSANHSVGADFHLAALAAPTLTTTLGGVTNLDVRSSIVLSVGETVTAKAGGTITLTDLGGAGYQGENTTHSQTFTFDSNGHWLNSAGLVVDVISFVGNGANTKIVINPQFDLDLSSNYSLAVSTGAFHGSSSGQDSAAFTTINFSTVTPTTFATAAQGQAQEMVASTGSMQNSLKWFDLTNVGDPRDLATQTTLDFSANDYAAVVKGTDLSLTNCEFLGAGSTKLLNFGVNDLLYVDNQDWTNTGAQNSVNGANFASGNGTSSSPFEISVGGTDTTKGGNYIVDFVLDNASLALLPTNITTVAGYELPNVISTNWSHTGMVIAA